MSTAKPGTASEATKTSSLSIVPILGSEKQTRRYNWPVEHGHSGQALCTAAAATYSAHKKFAEIEIPNCFDLTNSQSNKCEIVP